MRRLKRLWKHVFAAWMAFAKVLGFVNTRIILSIFFFTLFGLYAVIMQLVCRRARTFRSRQSYWVPRVQVAVSEVALRRPF